MPWPCFLVERRNERVVPHQCDEEGCDGHDEHRFDLVRVDTGEIVKADVEFISGGLPVGAMWWQPWLTEKRPPKGPQDYDGFTEAELANLRQRAVENPEWYPQGVDAVTGLPNRRPSFLFGDGPVLCVQTPGGVWQIDSRASNCGLPWDYDHRCWCRHGDPPAVTVDKACTTCAAGAGSIQCGNYHGFLQGGVLTDG